MAWSTKIIIIIIMGNISWNQDFVNETKLEGLVMKFILEIFDNLSYFQLLKYNNWWSGSVGTVIGVYID